jgi:hypothetical protein
MQALFAEPQRLLDSVALRYVVDAAESPFSLSPAASWEESPPGLGAIFAQASGTPARIDLADHF